MCHKSVSYLIVAWLEQVKSLHVPLMSSYRTRSEDTYDLFMSTFSHTCFICKLGMQVFFFVVFHVCVSKLYRMNNSPAG